MARKTKRDFSRMNDPSANYFFSRRWSEPAPRPQRPQRRRRPRIRSWHSDQGQRPGSTESRELRNVA